MFVHRASMMVALVLALAAPGSAAAGPPAGDPDTVARTIGDEGLRRFRSGDWQDAYDLFRRAEGVLHAPTLVLYMAHCQARLGNLLSARRLYRSVVDERLAEGAPVQFQTAQGVAREELRWLSSRLARISIVVPGVVAGTARVLVDGAEVPAAELRDLAVVPGEHVVEASVHGGAVVRRTIASTAGVTVRVVIPLAPAAGGEPEADASRAATAQKDPASSAGVLGDTPPAVPGPAGPRSLIVPAGVCFGVGGAALLAGAITGGVSLSAANDVKSRCSAGGHCLASDQAKAASAGQLADVSTGMFVAGGVAVATGVVLAVLRAGGRKERTEPAVHVDIGLGYGALRGGF
jgi:hypothetical protein